MPPATPSTRRRAGARWPDTTRRKAGSRQAPSAQKDRSYPVHVRMVFPRQVNVLHGHCQRRVAQPFLQDVDRYALEDTVAPVGVPEGVGMDPGRLNTHLRRSLLHSLSHRLAGEFDQRPVAGPGLARGAVPEYLHQVLGDGGSPWPSWPCSRQCPPAG